MSPILDPFSMRRQLFRAATALVVANSFIALTGCGGSEESTQTFAAAAAAHPDAPAPPPPDIAPPQTPTTQTPPPAPSPPPVTYSATVSWSVPLFNTDGTSLTDVAGYRIYYKRSPTELIHSVSVSGSGVTNHVISGLTAGTYYFAVATVNSTGVASDISNAVSKTLP